MAVEGIIGIKLGMSSVYGDDNARIPVTLVDVSGCTITQVKTAERDGYNAVQIGHGTRKHSLNTKPLNGHLAASESSARRLAEFRVDDTEGLSLGQAVTGEIFSENDKLKITGITKGRGFSGVMRRHGFSGAQKTHGQSDRQRAPGSIGSGTYPGRVIPGMKMAGHYGTARQTTRGLKLVKVDNEAGILFVKGAVPGPKNGVLLIQKQVQGK